MAIHDGVFRFNIDWIRDTDRPIRKGTLTMSLITHLYRFLEPLIRLLRKGIGGRLRLFGSDIERREEEHINFRLLLRTGPTTSQPIEPPGHSRAS